MKKIQLLLTVLFLTISLQLRAEDPDPAPGDPGTVPAAPIDDYVPFAILAVVGLSYVMLRKKAVNE